MGKFLTQDAKDNLLNTVADNGSRLDLCSQEPSDYSEATDTYSLANTSLSTGDGNGDYTLSDDGTGGRELEVDSQDEIDIDSSGDVTHVAITDPGNNELLFVTTATEQPLTAGNKANTSSFALTVSDIS